MGSWKPDRGSVLLGARDVTGWAAPRLGRLGLTRTFQDIRLFKDLTTYENVAVGAVGARMPRTEVAAWVDEVLDRLDLSAKKATVAGSLAHGDQRRAALARALATRPAFLLLDEPTAGLTEPETDALIESMRRISAELGCGTLVIEHDMRLIMGACDRIQVLDHGNTIAVGTPAEIRVNPVVLAAYFRTSGGADA